jgi:hypothetical protein
MDTARTEFTITVSFIDGGRNFALGVNVDSLVSALQRNSTNASIPTTVVFNRVPVLPPGEFALNAVNERIEGLPLQQWENQVRAFGMNLRTEARGEPRLEILRTDKSDGTGEAHIAEVRENLIRIIGTAPSSGLMTVRVAARRASDSKEQNSDFTIRSVAIPQPDVPRRMYAGMSYEFDAKLPFVTGQDLKAALSLNGKERSVGLQGAKFTFTPEEADIGKIFTFERTIGGKRVGEVYSVRVEEFSAPEVVEVFSQGASEMVRTRCYGQLAGDDNRVTLEVKGNIAVRERYGDRRSEPPAIIQLFEIRRAEADKPFTGTLRAIDRKGRASIAKFIDRKE